MKFLKALDAYYGVASEWVQANRSILGILIALGLGTYGGYYFTKMHYTESAIAQMEADQKNLICEARIQRGRMGDVKSEYFVIEQSKDEADCKKFINYANLPDDTESVWMGL